MGFVSSTGIPFTLKNPDLDGLPEEEQSEILEHMTDLINDFEGKIYQRKDTVNTEACGMDLQSFITWYLVNELSRNNDSVFFSSVYLYYDPADRLLHMGPSWDFDLAFGNIDFSGNDNPVGYLVRKSGWFSPIFSNGPFAKDVRETWVKRIDMLRKFGDAIQKQAEYIKVSALFNFIRWPILGSPAWPDADGYADRQSYEEEVKHLIEWTNMRIAWMDGEFIKQQDLF